MNIKEYTKHLNKYSSDLYSLYTKSISDKDWGDRAIAEQYLAKYWLPEEEYMSKWKPVQNQIFVNQTKGLPEVIFTPTFEVLAITGGVLFVREDFEKLQANAKAIGDQNLVIIQNTFGEKTSISPLRVRYPIVISWDELMSGNFISSVLFEMFANEYFVFSESGSWGKYSANDYENPLDIIGFKPEYATIFKEQFKQSEEEWEEIKEWLPPSYKDLVTR